MKLNELTTPLERHGIMHYAADGNKIVRHNYDMQQISGPLYRGVERRNDFGELCFDLFLVYPGVRYGLRFERMARIWDDYTAEKLLARVKDAKMDSPESYAQGCMNRMNEGTYIFTVDIEFVRQFDSALAERCAAYRLDYLEKKKQRDAARRAQQQAEEEARKREQDARDEAELQDAIACIRNGQEVENRHGLVNTLCHRFGIQVPLRTQGWINASMYSFTTKNGRGDIVRYYKSSRRSKCSQKIHDILNELIAAVCAQAIPEQGGN